MDGIDALVRIGISVHSCSQFRCFRITSEMIYLLALFPSIMI